MSVVDNKGRLFGLINIIDLAVLLMVVLLAAGVFARVSGGQSGAGTAVDQQDLQVTFLLPEVMEFAADSFQVGDNLVSTVGGATVGEIVAIQVEPLGQLLSVGDGKSSGAGQQRYNVYLTVASKGQLTNAGVRIAQETLFIGDVLFVQTNISKGRVVLTQVEEI